MSDCFYIAYLLNCIENRKIPITEDEYIKSMKKKGMTVIPGYYRPQTLFLENSEKEKVIDALADFIIERQIPINNDKDILGAMCGFKNHLYSEMVHL